MDFLVSPESFEGVRIGKNSVGSLRGVRTEVNTDANRESGRWRIEPSESWKGRRFEPKPMNQPTIPRQRWTERRPANALKYAHDDDDRVNIMKRYRTQKRLEDRDKGRDRKQKLRFVPQVGKALSQLEIETSCSNSNNQNYEPQMFRFPQFSLDQESRESLDSFTQVISDATYTVQRAVEMSESVTGRLSREGVKVTHGLDVETAKLMTNMSEFAVLVVIIVVIVLLKPKSQSERALVFAILVTITLTRVDLRGLLEKVGVMDWFKPKAEPVPQMFEELSREDITHVISAMLNIYVLGSFGTDLVQPKELLRVTTQISRMTPTVQNISTGVQIMVEFLSKVFKTSLGSDGFVSTGHKFIDHFFEQYHEIVDLWEKKELYNRQTSVDRVKALIAEGEHMVRLLPGSPSKFVTIRVQMLAATKELEKIRHKLMSSNFRYTGCRTEPTSLLMMGKPGVFKSQAMQHIANAINALILSPEEFERYRESPTATTYNRQHESVYWDGYSQDKHVCLIDDLGQARDIQGNPDNEVMNVIRMINIFENILHMAAIDDKGNTHFRSKFVIANTNLFSFNFESINEVGAFMRRWNIAVVVVPKPEFSVDPEASPLNRRFDEGKIPLFTEDNCRGNTKLIGTTRTHPNMCDFHVQRLSHNCDMFIDSGEVLDFKGLVHRLHEMYLRNESRGAGYLVTLEDTLDEFREEAIPQMGGIVSAIATPIAKRYSSGADFQYWSFNVFEKWYENRVGKPLWYRKEFYLQDTRFEWDFYCVEFLVSCGMREDDMPQCLFKEFNSLGGYPIAVELCDIEDYGRFISFLLKETSMSATEAWCQTERQWPKYAAIFWPRKNEFEPEMDDLCDAGSDSECSVCVPQGPKREVYGPKPIDKDPCVGAYEFWGMNYLVRPDRIRYNKVYEGPLRKLANGNVRAIVSHILAHIHAETLDPDGLITYLATFVSGNLKTDPVETLSSSALEFKRLLLKMNFGIVYRFCSPTMCTRSYDVLRVSCAACLPDHSFPTDDEDSDLGEADMTPVPQMGDWESSNSLESVPPERVSPDLYTLTDANAKRMAFIKFSDWQRGLLVEGALIRLARKKKEAYDEDVDLNDLFGVLCVLSKNKEKYADIGSSCGFNLQLFDDDAQKLYDERKPVFEDGSSALSRFDRGRISSLLSQAGSAATSLQRKLYDLYLNAVLYLAVAGETAGDALLQSVVKDENLRRQLGGFAALTGGFYMAIQGAKILFKTVVPIFSSHSDERSNRVGRSRRLARRPGRAGPSIPQSIATQNKNVKNAIDMVVSQSLLEVHIPLPKSERDGTEKTHKKAGYALAVKGWCWLMPWHFYATVGSDFYQNEELEADDKVIFRRPNTQYVHAILTVSEFCEGHVDWDEGEKMDICLIKVPRRCPPARDITRHIAPKKQHDNYTKCDAVLCIPSEWKEVHRVAAKLERDMSVGDDLWEPFTVSLVYAYYAETTYGDCGALLHVNDKQSTASIIGMHVAGVPNTGKGCSARLTREFVEEYLRVANETYEVEPIGEGENKLTLEPDDTRIANMTVVGRATPESAIPRQPLESKIVPSLLKDKYFVSKKSQSALKPFWKDGVRVEPMIMARAGYSPGDIHISESYLESAKDSLYDYLVHNSSHDVEKCIMTYQQAVLGYGPGSELQSIPRKTSSGYPYSVLHRPTNKTYFFGDKDEFDLTTPEALDLEREVERCEVKIKKGVRCNFVFIDSLKDEKRPIEKVQVGKTRMFSGSPLVYLILCRKYFGSFMMWCVKNRIENGIAIGVNQYSSEWDHIACNLNKFGTGANKGAGDYSGLDKNERARINWHIVDLVNRWYSDGEENAHVRNMLALDLINSLHINQGLVMYWNESMPSGHFLTALFNSLHVHMCFRLTWIDLIRPKSIDAHEFNEKAYLIILGDDHVYSVHPDYREIFTERRVGQSMLNWGQTYTPETKEGELRDVLRALEEVSFLKRRWRYEASSARFVAPLDLETVLDIANWQKKGGNVYDDVEVNVGNTLAELALHGKQTYDYWVAKICKAIEDVPGLSQPKITSYRLQLRETLSREGLEYNLTRPLTDYDDEGGNSTVYQPQIGRFRGSGAGLFRLTSRIARRQPRLYPGTRGTQKRLAQCTALIGAATITDKLGESSEGRTVVVETDQGSSALSSGTTHSEVDAGVVKGIMKYSPLSRSLLNNLSTHVENSIQSFLEKPKLVASGSLSTTDLFTTNKWSAYVPNDLLSGAGDIWQNKLEGTFGFRGTLHLTLQINGNRFQQGRYILAFCPTGGIAGPNNLLTFIQAHTCTLTEVTQLPHVEVDVNCDSEGSLEIPLINAQGWVPITKVGNTYGCGGFAFVTAYSPLVAPAGSTTAAYSIFAHFTNVEVTLPSVPQMARGGTKTRVVRRPRPADSEQGDKLGPIEAISGGVSTIAGALTGVPLLGSVVGQVKWIADIIRHSASAHGWSRPRNEGPAMFITKQVMHRATNVDAQDNSTKLAYFDRNELADMPDFAGGGIDEMNIQYICGISAYFESFTWNTGQSAAAIIYSHNLNPASFMNQKSIASQTITHMVPVAYVSQFFSLWRGSLKLTFKFVKTEFHSGRLAVVFQPLPYPVATTVPTLAQSQYNHRNIIDLRLGSEFTIEFPYVGFSQYKDVPNYSGGDYSIGTVLMFVLNPLVAPANVSSTITCLVEASAGEDIEFAQPRNPTGYPVAQATPQIGRSDCEVVSEVSGGARTNSSVVTSGTCIGERILSLRSLLKRFSAVSPTTPFNAQTANRVLNVAPFTIPISQIDSTPALKRALNINPDLFSFVAPLYAFYRGGMRMKFYNRTAQDDVHLEVGAFPNNSGTQNFVGLSNAVLPLAAGDSLVNRPFAFARGDAQGSAEVEFPFYSRFPMMCVGDFLVNDSTTLGVPQTAVGPNVYGYCRQCDVTATAHYPPAMFRAMAEDGSLGMFVSTVPINGFTANFQG